MEVDDSTFVPKDGTPTWYIDHNATMRVLYPSSLTAREIMVDPVDPHWTHPRLIYSLLLATWLQLEINNLAASGVLTCCGLALIWNQFQALTQQRPKPHL